METRNNETIGERLRTLRVRNNLKQEELARKLHLGSRSMISELETNKRQVTSAVIVDYSEYFDVSSDWIVFGREDMERRSLKTETDEVLKAFFAIRNPAVRRVAIDQIRALSRI